MLKKVVFTLKIIFLTLAVVLVAAFFTFLTFPRTTFGVADNATLNVTVEQIAEITVLPTILQWNLKPCYSGGSKTLDIKNSGSLNVSNIYAYVGTLDNETSRPYGSPNADDYAATGLIVLRNETESSLYFAGRIEWNWTEDISNKDFSDLGAGCTGSGGNCSWGFIRNTSYEYMWAVSNGTNGLCNNTGTLLGLESDVDNGTAASRKPMADTEDGIYFDSSDANYSYFLINRTGGHVLNGSCVAVSINCTKLYVYKYDRRTSPFNFATCDFATNVQTANLVPFDIHTLTLDAYAPCGIPEGSLAIGNIYIIAS